jgi:hypothetical protein
METRFSFSLKQLVLLVLLTVFVAVGLTMIVFLVGQQSVFGLFALRGTATPTFTPTMPPLPKAMTATPVQSLSQTYVLTEEQINGVVAQYSDATSVLTVDEVKITPEYVQMIGDINYNDYQGNLIVSGMPSVLDRRLRFQLVDVTLNGQSMPQILYPTIEEQIDLLFEEILRGYDIDSVELGQGRIIVMVVPWDIGG